MAKIYGHSEIPPVDFPSSDSHPDIAKPNEKRRESFWHRNRCNFIWLVLVIMLLAALICMIVLWYKWRDWNTGEIKDNSALTLEEKDSVCYTADCTLAAALLLNNVNMEKDPCDDFYEFACGRFAERHEIENGETSNGAIGQVEKQLIRYMRALLTESIAVNDTQSTTIAKIYYQSCTDIDWINTLDLSPLYKHLREIGPWPVLNRSEPVEPLSWNERHQRLQQAGYIVEYAIPLSIRMKEGENHTSEMQLELGAFNFNIHFTIPIDPETFAVGYNSTTVKEYETFLIELAMMLGADRKTAEADIPDVINFFIDVSEVSFSLIEEVKQSIPDCDFEHPTSSPECEPDEYNTTLGDLRLQFPQVDWDVWLSMLEQGQTFNDNSVVSLMIPLENITYLTDYLEIIQSYSDRTIANIALLPPIVNALQYLPEDYYELVSDFVKQLLQESGEDGEPDAEVVFDRWKRCTMEVMSFLPNIASSLYVKEYFRDAAKTEIGNLVMEVKNALKEILAAADWIDDVTRAAAIRKVDLMSEKIGYSDKILDEQFIFSRYSEFKFFNDTYFENALGTYLLQSNESLMLLRESQLDKSGWPMPATVVNAMYDPASNEIVFPAGILQQEFFNPNVPSYYNYGRIGSVIGHEITHGFDDSGSKFDEYGNEVNWWQKETLARYLERTQCFIDQFNNIVEPATEMQLNGNLTLGENIADAGGLKITYKAYKAAMKQTIKKLPGFQRYDSDQMFFIAYASNWCSLHKKELQKFLIENEEHSLGRYRITEPLKNMQEFSDVFKCAENAAMNPSQKCELW